MKKILNLEKTVYELVQEYPEIKDIMNKLGFKEITNPMALNLMGKIMTIPKGSAIKGIAMDKIIEAFKSHGFEIVNSSQNPQNGENLSNSQNSTNLQTPQTKAEKLKSYITRLNNGEELESVRKDFVSNFESVSVHEIIGIEQEMINSGTSISEVQRLCDLHSALFHGRTEQEIYADEEKRLKEKVETGHPIDILKQENKALEIKLDELNSALNLHEFKKVKELVGGLRKIRILYGKKEMLIIPVLYRYGVEGPSTVMWGVDDEIKAEFGALFKELNETNFSELKNRIYAVVARAKEMIYKEENILFPMALERFSKSEWVEIYADLPEMGNVFIETAPKWEFGENLLKDNKPILKAQNGVVHLEGGTIKVKQLNSLLKLLPIDITFIDENEINRLFTNEGKVFSRPKSALGRKMYDCHPQYIVPMIKQMLGEFKAGTKDNMEFWTPNPQNPIRVLYCAVRGEKGEYLGAVEFVQQFKDIKDKLKENFV